MKRMMILCILLLWPAAFAVAAEGPRAMVKTHVDEVVRVLNDPALEGKPQAKLEKIKDISKTFFDYEELSKRSLGANWRRFTPEQQKTFVSLYQKLLEKAYGDRILEYSNEKIDIGKERPLSPTTVVVPTTVVRQGGNISIDYRLTQENGKWLVYDVVIEGVSLVSNYRAQFRDILANSSPDELIEKLRKKVS